jgi:ubiquinone/menaquinone biosynthesis C-methylase UbiE
MTEPSGMDKLKTAMRGTWMAGDFGKVAEHIVDQAEWFVDQLNVEPGMRVLDVACGTGNLSLPAARKGASVTGVDIATNLLEQARQRAAAEGLSAEFIEGDAEQLPFADNDFDLVMSMFGAMFAPRPELVAAELARVCRHGGTVAMANWSPSSFAGRMFAVSGRYIPPPVGIPAPVLWGDEATASERLIAHGLQVETERHPFTFKFPYPPKDVVQFFREYFGPTKMAFAKLDEAIQQAYAADLEAFWAEHNEATDETTKIPNEYLVVIAKKP